MICRTMRNGSNGMLIAKIDAELKNRKFLIWLKPGNQRLPLVIKLTTSKFKNNIRNDRLISPLFGANIVFSFFKGQFSVAVNLKSCLLLINFVSLYIITLLLFIRSKHVSSDEESAANDRNSRSRSSSRKHRHRHHHHGHQSKSRGCSPICIQS